MGNALDVNEGNTDERPVHTVTISAFYMDRYEVTKALWDEVRAWAAGRGYTDLPAGGGKGFRHPVQEVSWYDAVKWANARSQRDGRTPVYGNWTYFT
jgi:formylglycine-generating enzyme required for sulfatase activity